MSSYTPDSRINVPTLGDPEIIKQWFRDQGVHDPEVDALIDTYYEFCPQVGLGAHLLVCQFIHECSDPDTGKPAASDAWRICRNPAGIGVTSDAMRLWHDFETGRNGGLAHIVRVCKYVFGPVPDVLTPYEHLDPRGPVPASVYGQKKTLGSFGHPDWRNHPTWATDGNYGNKWARVANRLSFMFQEEYMATYRTTLPGLPGGPIQTSFPVHLMIVPSWRTNNRPGIKARTPRLTVQHETANPNTYAKSEATYLYNGAGGRQASWHLTVDDREAYLSIPLDEVTWQAGDGAGPGNYNGISCELSVHRDIVNNPTRRAQAQKNAAELLGRIGARLNAAPPPRQHADFMRKNCPEQMRNRGEWNRYVDWWWQFYNAEKAAMGGTPIEQPKEEIIHIGDTIEALVNLNLRQAPRLSAPVITTLPAGTRVTVYDRYEWADAIAWLPVESSSGRGWVAMGQDGTKYIKKVASKPEEPEEPEEPTFVEPKPIPALLDTDLSKYDTAPGIITDDTEQDYIFVADVIEFTKPTVAGQEAVDNPKPVHEGYGPGDRAIAAWLVKSRTTKKWHYILTGGDDEWVRVPYENTKRVSDAPLLGDEWDTKEPTAEDVIDVIRDILDEGDE